MNNEAYVEVNRTSQLMNKMRKFSVLIDGVEAGKIKDGGRLRIDLEPGEHEIQVKIDWCVSQALRFTLDEGEALKFRCGSPVRGWKMFFSLFYVLADPEKYSFIVLEEAVER
ncbi:MULTISPECIES: hypothetical protein [Bacillus]|nr:MULTISPECIES: hypothetical protein [Bacillus]MDN5388993.1 hypothetical protein [Bacillus sp. LB7]MEC1023122.1 hypothetical protein [Bacillus paralicheniformis]MEC1025697.1 hypothetical protein [Bacillus paralicheniformis]MEC1035523.1 hypothetical protein [Bacillus paralicheniformis]MEC1051611.1 hypothetical protein [Bacillus paralicheniformis]